MFPVARSRAELPEKTRVFGLEQGGVARAWPLDALVERGVVNDAVGSVPVVLVARGGELWVDGESVRDGPARYSAGAEVRAYERGERTLRAGEGAGDLVDEAGRRWRLEEEGLSGPGGERLERRPGVLAYWFAWQAFHPRTELYGR
jgi:hypothetical protein